METFDATVQLEAPNPYVVVPADVSEAFAAMARKGRVRVIGTLNGDVEIRANLVPRADGHRLFLHAGMRAAAGVGVGDRVRLALRAAPWDEVPVPSDIAEALAGADAAEVFAAKGPEQQHELLRWIEVAESAAERARRTRRTIALLRGDLAPSKPGQAHRRRRPLWTCPACGHVFVNRNQWHSCRRVELDEPFAKAGPEVRALFDGLRGLVESVGPVLVQAYRDKVAFLVRVRFLGAAPRRRWLDVSFWLPERLESPRFRKVETLTPTDHVHTVRLTSAADLDDELLGWVRRAYAVGEQRHLGE